MPYKIGGGEKPQLYDKNNGEYVLTSRDEAKLDNLIIKKLYGIDAKTAITYPIYGKHSKEYCDKIVKYIVDIRNPIVPIAKLTNYLLIFKDKNDKSMLLSKIGYTMENWEELRQQLLIGTNFKRRKLAHYDENAFTLNAETQILNKNKGTTFKCTTAWYIEKDFTIRFVTLILEEYKDGE